MQFFELTHPPYMTDREADARNPVMSTARYRIPGMSCDVCGRWSSSSRLRVPLPSVTDEFTGVRFLPVNDWIHARDRWARLLNMEADDLEPGAELGPPIGRCTSAIREDVVHPAPGLIWVTARVRDALATAGLTGVSYAKVELSPECGDVGLVELVVHGRAWRKGSTVENLKLCDICGRSGFPSPKNLAVDETRWDGSDFVILDHNPNIIVVTERVAEVLGLNNFTNIVVEPIS